MGIKATLKIAIGVALVVGLVLASYEVFFFFTHVYESNARIQTELTHISAQVDGKIEAILVKEGSLIEKGQVLVVLVHNDIELDIEALRTDLKLERARRERLISEKSAYEIELESKYETQREKIRAIEVEHKSLQDRIKLAEKNLARVKYLFDKKLKPEESLTAEQDKLLAFKGRAAQLRANIAVARKELDQLKAAAKRIDVIVERIKISDIEQSRIEDMIRKQKISLSYRRITSPIDGVIGRIHRFAGEYVEDGVTILMLHNPELYWVEAYVDESQIRHLRIGQDVRINFDAYPFEDFFGKLRRIGNVTTAEMGLQDKVDNGTSFGSQIERVPVRISIENSPPNLTPGMRAEVNVRIYDEIRLW